MTARDRVLVFDTTLRDGEQAPGCTMTVSEKLEVARQLARLGVDVIEAGFPASSAGELDAVRTIAAELAGRDAPIVCALARAHEADIDRCMEALAATPRRRIHTFLATSDIHLEHKLRIGRREALERVARMVAYARAACSDVEFSPEDACRSDPVFLCDVLTAAIEAGATTLNIPDTVGYATPDEYGALVRRIVRTVPGMDRVIVSTHCHDDLGLAVANSLAGLAAGARQVECTINGIGERAGNASLEEIVMALHTRASHFPFATGIRTTELSRTSRLVATCTGVAVPPNKAIVGANAFAHEAGIHQDGVLKHPSTYEIIAPEVVGFDHEAMVLGKHSGRRAFRRHVEHHLGLELSDEQFHAAFVRFKDLADRKKTIDERDLEAIVYGEARRPTSVYEIQHVQVSCGTYAIPTATVRLRARDGEIRTEVAQGTGPVHAVCEAINRIVGDVGELVEFAVTAVTEGISAVGEVTIKVREHASPPACPEALDPTVTQNVDISAVTRNRRRTFTGYGVHTDIVVAAAEAYVAALNRLLATAATSGPASTEAPYQGAAAVPSGSRVEEIAGAPTP